MEYERTLERLKYYRKLFDQMSLDETLLQYRDYFQMALETIDEDNISELLPDIEQKIIEVPVYVMRRIVKDYIKSQ